MLDKAIRYGKEYRKPYYRRGRVSLGCRPHGWCSYCLSSRKYQETKAVASANDKLKEYEDSSKINSVIIRGINGKRRRNQRLGMSMHYMY